MGNTHECRWDSCPINKDWERTSARWGALLGNTKDREMKTKEGSVQKLF